MKTLREKKESDGARDLAQQIEEQTGVAVEMKNGKKDNLSLIHLIAGCVVLLPIVFLLPNFPGLIYTTLCALWLISGVIICIRRH